jgi:hypothetical protein
MREAYAVPAPPLWIGGSRTKLKLLIDRAEQAAGGAAVSVIAYQGDYMMAREELKVIDATAHAKNCGRPR